MSDRTDNILAAISAELEERREEIEGDKGLSTISLVIRLDARTDAPFMVIYRTESHRRITSQ